MTEGANQLGDGLPAAKASASRYGRPCACGDHVWAAATMGFVVLVSPDDSALLERNKWSVSKQTNRIKPYYSVGRTSKIDGKKKRVLLSRAVLCPASGEMVDHINHNTFDNRRKNLRVCTATENACNRSANTGQRFKGVIATRHGKFQAEAKIFGERVYLGVFETAQEAAEARARVVEQLHGDFACHQ